jgi:hypothetical protein
MRRVREPDARLLLAFNGDPSGQVVGFAHAAALGAGTCSSQRMNTLQKMKAPPSSKAIVQATLPNMA